MSYVTIGHIFTNVNLSLHSVIVNAFVVLSYDQLSYTITFISYFDKTRYKI